ncbi:MAG: hypothetical protein IIB57_00950 [Planctomycetes bacterium]|nr:hypothetical protein [Planctomycetota bacterium]
MSYDKNRLADSLKKVYAFTSEGVDDPNNYRRCKMLGGSGTRISFSTPGGGFEGVVEEGQGATLMIVDDGVDAFDAFIDEALKDDEIREVIGRGAIQKQLEDLLRSTQGTLPDGEIAKTIRFEIMKPLRENIRVWHSFVPIVNLNTKATLRLGDVEFVSAEEMKAASVTFIEEHRFGSDDTTYQEKQRQAILSRIDNSCQQTPSFARVALRAHQERTADVAADKALIALNILRAHTHLFYTYDQKALVGLPTELSAGAWQTVSLSQDESRTLNLKQVCKGPLLPFDLDEKKIDYLNGNCHLVLLQEILDKSCQDRNSFESAVIQAFQSLGRAIVAPTIDMRFLGCTIALERMLTSDDEKNTTTERWSDRLALAVARDSSHRQVIIKRAKRLYELRSRIVHAAYSGVSDADARLMERWALRVIFLGLEGHANFSCHGDFCNTVDPRNIGLGFSENTR